MACAFCVERAEAIEVLRTQIFEQHERQCLSCVERQALNERLVQQIAEERVLLTLLFSKAIAKRDAEIAALRECVNGHLRLVRRDGG